MPPRKRKAATAAASAITATSGPRKKVRIGDESVIGDDSNSRVSTPASTSSGRVQRATSNANPQYNFTRTRGSSKTAGAAQRGGRGGATRGRGRPPKAASHRGRPKAQAEEPQQPEDEPESEEEQEPEPPHVSTPVPKGILKKKNTNVDLSQTQGEDSTMKAGKGRGRGRPRKSVADIPQPEVNGDEATVETKGATKGRGRPKKAAKATKASGKLLVNDEIDGLTDDEAIPRSPAGSDVDPEVQYWLMKAEPDSRIEKGVDVKFSIDDLQSRDEPEGWDGVRNPAARNNMRAMRCGDLAFFYHSNCKTPGIVGIMRIVEEHQVDESAFDPDHPYYDANSDPSKPKWELVKVEFVKKFVNMLTLRELKSYAGTGGKLANMQMLRQGRLSVSSVSPQEWHFILECVGEDAGVGQPSKQGGYDGDTDGEAETQVAEVPEADDLAQPELHDSGVGLPANGSGNTVVSLGDGADPGEPAPRGGMRFREEDWESDGDEGDGMGDAN